MSFVNATLVLSIGETVEEVTDSGFLGTTPTLSCSALGDDALVQVKLAQPIQFNGKFLVEKCKYKPDQKENNKIGGFSVILKPQHTHSF